MAGKSKPVAMTGGMAIVEALIANGIDTVYGLPGAQLYALFDALQQRSDRIRTIGARHEQACGYMALGHARSTGRPGVYAVVPGPGVLNTTAALCTAQGTCAPVLCITGQVPSAFLDRGRALSEADGILLSLAAGPDLTIQEIELLGLTLADTRFVLPNDAELFFSPQTVSFGGAYTGERLTVDVDVSCFGTGIRRMANAPARPAGAPPLMLSMMPLGRRRAALIEAEDDARDVEIAAEEAQEAALEADEARGDG